MQDGFDAACRLLPERMRPAGSAALRREAEEFRLRRGRPPTVLVGNREHPLDDLPVTEAELRGVLDAATRSSLHAVADQLRRGYISTAAAGGVRVGVCGTAVTDGGIRTLRELSSLSIRIPRQIHGAGGEILPRLKGQSVLILSPPGGGKTTFLRELVRSVSDAGVRVGLADERGEIAAAFGGEPGFDVGRCTDVLTGAPKAEAALLLLRSMNPQAVALDEISDPADAEAVRCLAGCGVLIYATAHAASVEEFRQKRPLYRELLDSGVFRRAVTIANREGRRSYAVINL